MCHSDLRSSLPENLPLTLYRCACMCLYVWILALQTAYARCRESDASDPTSQPPASAQQLFRQQGHLGVEGADNNKPPLLVGGSNTSGRMETERQWQ